MNKQDIINSLTGLDIPKATADAAVNHVFGEIHEALNRGEEVRLSGFGVFKRVATPARTCRNPHNGEAIEVPAGSKIKFKASSKLKE